MSEVRVGERESARGGGAGAQRGEGRREREGPREMSEGRTARNKVREWRRERGVAAREWRRERGGSAREMSGER